MDSFDFPDDKENQYRNILQKSDTLDLEKLSKLDKQSFEKNLIQTQINELKQKGLKNLSPTEKVQFVKLNNQFIALLDSHHKCKT